MLKCRATDITNFSICIDKVCLNLGGYQKQVPIPRSFELLDFVGTLAFFQDLKAEVSRVDYSSISTGINVRDFLVTKNTVILSTRVACHCTRVLCTTAVVQSSPHRGYRIPL